MSIWTGDVLGILFDRDMKLQHSQVLFIGTNQKNIISIYILTISQCVSYTQLLLIGHLRAKNGNFHSNLIWPKSEILV